jgi:hypothetical protein
MNNLRRLIDILRLCLISFEAVFVLAIVVYLYYFPSFFIDIGVKFKTNNEVWKLLPGIPLLYASVSIGLSWKVLIPSDNSKTKILYQWPEYWRLKYRVVASFIICGMAAIGSIIIWVWSNDLSECTIGTIFISSMVVPVPSIFTQFLAAFKVRELLDIYS